MTNKIEEITIVEPSFPVALYEMEKLIKQGYRVSQVREPIYIAGLYEIVMEQEFVTHDTVESLMADLNEDQLHKEIPVTPVQPQGDVFGKTEVVKRGPKPKAK
jgi:hypothetical protein